MSDKIEMAREIAKRTHAGQKDKQGQDYFLHPEKVASFVDSEEAKIVAYLHDTIEDGNEPELIDDIERLFGREVAHAVRVLTRTEGTPYFDYISEIKKCPLAKEVKLADLKHNMDTTRGEPIPSLLKRYKKAMEILTDDERARSRE